MSQTHVTIEPRVLYVGTPIALVTTTNPDGGTNIGPMSSAWAIGRTVVLGWGTGSQTLANLERDGQCVVNYPHARRWPQVEQIALLSGSDPLPPQKQGQFRTARDKWTPGGFTAQPSTVVRPPRIAECAIQCEAEVQAIHAPSGPDADDFRMVEVYVRAVHADREVVDEATGHVDTTAWSPALYVFREYFGTGDRLGRTRRR
ncbi:flavin reductase family protein [Isoptericola sp. NPDC019693]|uniref:flavin reductase family protein n=1 Tax=Isoptericola sp. NPDC019693 TaxID=3364009 RepID=UPI003799782C